MPRHSKLRWGSVRDVYQCSSDSICDFLTPALSSLRSGAPRSAKILRESFANTSRDRDQDLDDYFLQGIVQAARYNVHRREGSSSVGSSSGKGSHGKTQPRLRYEQHQHTHIGACSAPVALGCSTLKSNKHNIVQRRAIHSQSIAHEERSRHRGSRASTTRWLGHGHSDEGSNSVVQSWIPPHFFTSVREKQFAELSRLPLNFFQDIQAINNIVPRTSRDVRDTGKSRRDGTIQHIKEGRETPGRRTSQSREGAVTAQNVLEQAQLLKSIRELEEKLATAKRDLHASMTNKSNGSRRPVDSETLQRSEAIVLSKDDYLNFVDLYYYSHNSRFSPESTDLSPTPTFLDDVSFTLSADFATNEVSEPRSVDEDEGYESPLQLVEARLRTMKSREVAVMQVFVDLLLDERSSNKALYEAYRALPDPGVAYLPKGIIRVFLQRMSTPWTRSEKVMLRYLSLIDDMQRAKVPILVQEWNSAIYLAGRSFARVTEKEVATSFSLWKKMESETEVQSSHVTFNILFDIAVRAGKFALAQTILVEMSKRNLRLNRLGRVSLIYYHGLRGDGDGVRKAYHDFVQAGEIVDTLVLNCVIASLLSAQEPTAAEQVYARMKSLHERRTRDWKASDPSSSFTRYPPPEENRIGPEMASNHLGRILERAPHLLGALPGHHQALQASMPLVPDYITFRAMIAHHANKSGDLDRIGVLMHEMTDIFGLPINTLVFQLLFKGFAVHGPVGGPDSRWSTERLDIVWKAFRRGVLDTRDQNRKDGHNSNAQASTMNLPSITQIHAMSTASPAPGSEPSSSNTSRQQASDWENFVLGLTNFSATRRRQLQEFHTRFSNERVTQVVGGQGQAKQSFESPFFSPTVYTSLQSNTQHEKTEYILPSPSDITFSGLTSQLSNPVFDRNFKHGHESLNMDSSPRGQVETRSADKHEHIATESRSTMDREDFGVWSHSSHDPRSALILPNRRLVSWVLRAYARNTLSRVKVEEIWGNMRKIWRPKDEQEREAVIRVLKRCLKYCDHAAGPATRGRSSSSGSGGDDVIP